MIFSIQNQSHSLKVFSQDKMIFSLTEQPLLKQIKEVSSPTHSNSQQRTIFSLLEQSKRKLIQAAEADIRRIVRSADGWPQTVRPELRSISTFREVQSPQMSSIERLIPLGRSGANRKRSIVLYSPVVWKKNNDQRREVFCLLIQWTKEGICFSWKNNVYKEENCLLPRILANVKHKAPGISARGKPTTRGR